MRCDNKKEFVITYDNQRQLWRHYVWQLRRMIIIPTASTSFWRRRAHFLLSVESQIYKSYLPPYLATVVANGTKRHFHLFQIAWFCSEKNLNFGPIRCFFRTQLGLLTTYRYQNHFNSWSSFSLPLSVSLSFSFHRFEGGEDEDEEEEEEEEEEDYFTRTTKDPNLVKCERVNPKKKKNISAEVRQWERERGKQQQQQ